MDKSSARVF